MKNRANVYKLQWETEKTEVIGIFKVNMKDRLTNLPRKFKHKKRRMDQCGWMWTGEPR
jgi:hypothetical protein